MPKLPLKAPVGPRLVQGALALVIVSLLLTTSGGVSASPSGPKPASLPVGDTARIDSSPATEALWAGLGPALAREAPNLLSKVLHPGATTPSLNISGFGIAAEGIDALSNNGVNFTSAIPPLPPGFSGGTTSVVVAVAGETLATNVSAVVGFAESSEAGITAALPIYAVNDSGTSIIGTGSIMLPGPTLHTFTMAETHGDWWSFTADGSLITGGLLGGSGNGTANLTVESTSLLSLSIPVFGYFIPENVSDLPLASIHTVLDVRSGSTWTPPTAGLEGLDEGFGVAGYLQDPTIPPDTVDFGGSYPVLGIGNLLWDTGALPRLTLATGPFPSGLTSGETVTFPAWVNASGSPLTSATITGADPLGGHLTVVGTGSTPGEQILSFQAAAVSTTEEDNLSVTAADTGYIAQRAILPFTVSPGSFVLGLPRSPLVVSSYGNLVVPLEINTTYSVGEMAANVTASPSSGNASVSPGDGVFEIRYSAPGVSANTSVDLEIIVSQDGFVSSFANLTVVVVPRPLTSSAAPVPWLAPGQTVFWTWIVSGPGLGPLPLTNLTWALTGRAGGGASPLTFGSPDVQFGGKTSVNITASSSFIGPVTLWVNASCPGYATAHWSEALTIITNLTVTTSRLPTNISGGSSTTIVAHVSGIGGLALKDVAVTWSTSAGNFAGAGSKVLTYTNAQGAATVTLKVPNGEGNQAVTVTVNASLAGYRDTQLRIGAEDRANLDNTLTTGATPWIIFAVIVLLLGACLLALGSRRRRQNATLSARTRPKKTEDDHEEPAHWAPGPEPEAVKELPAATPTATAKTPQVPPTEAPKGPAPETASPSEKPAD